MFYEHTNHHRHHPPSPLGLSKDVRRSAPFGRHHPGGIGKRQLGAHAPPHRPWRFRVFRGDALRRLGEFLSGQYRAGTSEAEFSDLKYKKMLDAPQRSGAVIAVCMQRDPENRVREWEEIAAVACAVQNMWLTCTSYGIGSYWSTPGYILQADEWLGLQPGERCLGLFYMGWYDEVELPAKRGSIEDKTLWINE